MPAYPFCQVGIVKDTIDLARTGTIRVWLEEFSGGDPDDQEYWKSVQYVTPFYGATPGAGKEYTQDKFTLNRQSYGMWFTAPDVGTRVVVFFINGDPDRGIYVGCLPTDGMLHMVPAIGAGKKGQEYTEIPRGLETATQLPVTEVNDTDPAKFGSGTYFRDPRPVHRPLAGAMFQQGLHLDNERGPITSSAQRESPSRVFGVSTPGRPVYQGGYKDNNFVKNVNTNPQASNLKVLARQGGHSLVMDDGDVSGRDQLMRLRSAKGHQIMLNDQGNFIHIIHANGQAWVELGSEGTLDVFSTNSINMRTQGTINLHADQDINLHAGGGIFAYSKFDINLNAQQVFNIKAGLQMNVAALRIGINATTQLALQSKVGSWNAGASLNLVASIVGLNSGAALPVPAPPQQKLNYLPDVKYQGRWNIVQNGLQSICTRAPTHEPYPFHNKGVNVTPSL